MKRILVGLSGGVDSAVAAYLLMQQGFDVTAGFMVNYITDDDSCTTKADLAVAKEVADFLGIKLHTFDFQQEYHDRIVTYIVDSYRNGLTPNPDVMCNSEIKFKLFLEEGIAMGFDAVATGHYAKIVNSDKGVVNGNTHCHPEPTIPVIASKAKQSIEIQNSKIIVDGENTTSVILNAVKNPESKNQSLDPEFHTGGQTYQLLKGIDPNKDQSYFLAGLNQEQLSKVLFPLGELPKSQVREIAHQAKLPNAERKDSQGICFIGKVPMKQFLEQYIPKQKGKIIDITGRILGEHEGAWGYTIGQRKGLGVAAPEPLFVIAKDVVNNTITVGYENDAELYSHDIQIKNRHWIGEKYPLPFTGHAKVRYRQVDQEMTMRPVSDSGKNNKSQSQETGLFNAHFTAPQRAIASGQILVVYDGDMVVGSGVIL